ncbi:MAG: hypothetical protein O4808_22075 [Trichodesmium sp. St17_bin3_1_1]|jgi:hypothetical protein|nr:hypothetical protein [Trichodesmium sp. St18_bin1]MDE5109630.1 hypothetical protein [Trichodesmium sp. St17_bin3_1_1]MDE5123552.1 hypothetical protein [Trichodesmium sp. St19_bin1]
MDIDILLALQQVENLNYSPPQIQRKIKADDRYKVSIREDSIII